MSVNLLEYRENINVEFSYKKQNKLPIRAIKTDGVSKNLKQNVGLGTVKTCDYISFRGHEKFWMIECTDLYKQTENLDAQIAQYSNKRCDINPDKKCLKKQARLISRKILRDKKDSMIKSELLDKCIGTSLLVRSLLETKNIIFNNRFLSRNYLIIINTNSLVSSVDRSFVIALEKLEYDLKNGLKGVVDSVKILTPEKFTLSVNSI